MNRKAEFDEIITLQRQDARVEQCENCNHLMVNLDEDEVRLGDLATLKRKKVRLSNPHTKDVICINCEHDRGDKAKPFLGKLVDWFDDDEDDDDTPLFAPRTPRVSTTPRRSASTGGGFSFGGFGGGGFSGGGASRGF